MSSRKTGRPLLTRRQTLAGLGAGLAASCTPQGTAPDAGADRDAGPTALDGGLDAGAPDAGLDGGVVDGGAVDGGADAGAPGLDGGVDAGPANVIWPAQTAGYVSALPGLTGFGTDSFGGSGRDGAPGRVTVFFLNDLSTATVNNAVAGYTRIREGSLRGFAAVPSPKVLIPTVSGTVNLGSDWRPGSYCDVYGQFAPGDGLVFRNTIGSAPNGYGAGATTAAHQRWWHVDMRAGDDAGGVEPGNRDSLYAGSAATDGYAGGGHNLYLNCAFLWSLDESVDAYYGLDLTTFAYCVFGEPLHLSIHDDGGVDSHGYGPVFGPGYRWDRLCFQRNLFAHAAARQPYVAALRLALANNVFYNPGDTSGNIASILQLVVDYDAPTPTTAAMLTNWVNNLVVKGPDSHPTALNVVQMDATTQQPAGSMGYLRGNAVDGYSFATQDALRSGAFPSGWSQGALLQGAWPSGWGGAFEGLYSMGSATAPNGFSALEKRGLAQRIFDSVGPHPGRRHPANRATTLAAQVLAQLDGSGDRGHTVNSVDGTAAPSGWPDVTRRFAPNAGGWPAIATVTENPFNPSQWHAPLPLDGNAPDDRVLTSGTFANGLGKAGLTALEAWALTERYRVGGA